MSAATSVATTKRIAFSLDTRDYDAYLGVEYVGTFPTEQHAQVELDRLACDPTEDGSAIDPRTPFAVGALPTTLAVADAAITFAYERVITAFANSPKVLERAERALELALQRTELITLLAADEISVRGSGSKPYRIRMEPLGTTCTCRDFWVAKRQAEHGGMCKHILAVELIRMAEADAAFDDAAFGDADSGIVFNHVAGITLDGALFVRACALAQCVAQTVTFALRDNLLRIAVGDDGLICGMALAGTVAGQPLALAIQADEFASLCAQLPSSAATCPHLAVALDATTVFVTDAALSFAAGATGTSIPR